MALGLSDVVGNAASSSTSGTAKVVTLPTAGVSVGMLGVIAIAITHSSDPAPTITSAPSGWVLADTNGHLSATSAVRCYVYTKILTAVDPSVSFTASASCGHVAQAFVVQTAVVGTAAAAWSVGSGTSASAPSISASSGSLIFVVHVCDDGDDMSGTAPTAYTDLLTTGDGVTTITTPGNGIDMAVAGRTWSGGATGTVVRTIVSEEWGAYTVEIAQGAQLITTTAGVVTLSAPTVTITIADVFFLFRAAGRDTQITAAAGRAVSVTATAGRAVQLTGAAGRGSILTAAAGVDIRD